MQPEFERSDMFNKAAPDKQQFARSLAAEGVAVINLPDPDFDEVARSVVSETERQLSGRGRLQDAWRRLPAVRRIATHPYVLEMLAFAYGRRPLPFQTLNFMVGTQQATHSDTVHFNCFPRNFMCGVWVAYEDTDEANGPLHYVPGSHRLPAMAPEDFGLAAGTLRTRNTVYAAYEAALARYVEAAGMKRVTATLRKGQALVWTANLFHGGQPILDKSRTRHSQVTHYYFDHCLYFSPLWSDLHGGRMSYKKVFDISTDRYVTPTYNGHPFRLPASAHLKEFVLAKLIGVRKS